MTYTLVAQVSSPALARPSVYGLKCPNKNKWHVNDQLHPLKDVRFYYKLQVTDWIYKQIVTKLDIKIEPQPSTEICQKIKKHNL